MKTAVKIKIAFLEKGISGAQIAREQGVDRTAIYHVIAGRSKSRKLRKAIARKLGKKVSALWPENDDRKAA